MKYTSEQAIDDLSSDGIPWMFASDLPDGYLEHELPYYIYEIPKNERPILLRGSRFGMRGRQSDRYWIERLWAASLRKLSITVLKGSSCFDAKEFVDFRNRFIDKFKKRYPRQMFDYMTYPAWKDLVAGKYVLLTDEQRESIKLLESIKMNLGKKSKRKEK